MTETQIKNTRLKDFIEITDIVSMTTDAGGSITASTLQNTIKTQQAGRKGYAPILDAVKVGAGIHSVWLVTRKSAEAWVAWKVGEKVRPRPKVSAKSAVAQPRK